MARHLNHIIAIAIVAVLIALFATTAAAFDPCADAGGEYRHTHNCASVIQKHSICCWKRPDGAHGILPKGCCATLKGWQDNNCELLLDEICDTHHEDL